MKKSYGNGARLLLMKDLFDKLIPCRSHGTLHQTHPNCVGSKYNLIAEREDGLVSPTSLSTMKETNKAECAEYAKEHNLLSTPGWKDLKKLASKSKYLVRALRQAKLKSFWSAPKHKFGFEVLNNYVHALALMQSTEIKDGRNLSSWKWINWWIMMLSSTKANFA